MVKMMKRMVMMILTTSIGSCLYKLIDLAGTLDVLLTNASQQLRSSAAKPKGSYTRLILLGQIGTHVVVDALLLGDYTGAVREDVFLAPP